MGRKAAQSHGFRLPKGGLFIASDFDKIDIQGLSRRQRRAAKRLMKKDKMSEF